ncbi:hypothetical protein HK103_003346 [Boothiomyces macroporosus]|uniref:Queuosine 5'-phosphate N-glycosylase/hydrolase n=1 Tax=Boothiomyces macroporosus TaxID=261099 RepID=A0AAD5UIY1_9FUNG|nr:hypothetical protein HK103_003346 [Boothiomyces macroporosus]
MNVKQSAAFIAENMQHVKINTDQIGIAADQILQKMTELQYDITQWKKHKLHPKSLDEHSLDWIFVMDLLNFSFWNERSERKRFQVTLDGEVYTGYWSLCAAMRRSLNEGIPITTPSFYANCGRDELRYCFRTEEGCDEMPLLETRIDMLQTAGKILSEYGGFKKIVEECNHSCQELIKKMIDLFGELFDDTVVYKGKKVSLQKRVQILVADIWGCFEGRSFGYFRDISTITMFADYRVPQGLLYFKLMEYSPELLSVLQKHQLHHESLDSDITLNNENMLKRGEEYEVEIRGASIHCVELLVEKLNKKIKEGKYKIEPVNAIIVDFYLWDISKEMEAEMKHLPYHRIRSIYY